ncbi:hypothetical protein J7E29_08485 [Streptomyces sp. ISL-90]|nr:hypothetical protein [Streptomyces sp. ISL-90]
MASSVRFRRAGFAAVALASVFLLAACAPGGGPAEHYAGLPGSEQEEEGGGHEPENEAGDPVAAWVAQGGQLAVTLWGSSSCPQVGRDIRVIEPAGEGNTVAIDLVERPEDEVCTMDFAPYTTVFWTPLEVTTTEPLKVEVADSTVTVPVK